MGANTQAKKINQDRRKQRITPRIKFKNTQDNLKKKRKRTWEGVT